MSNLTNPLASLLQAASKKEPEPRFKRAACRASNSDSTFDVQLLDLSGSMGDRVEGGQQKISILEDILYQLPYCPVNIGFNSTIKLITPDTTLAATGSTNLALAINAAAKYSPQDLLVISDGLPDSETAALEAAVRTNANISCFFIGKDSDTKGKRFLQKLAKKCHGKFSNCDISVFEQRKQLSQRIQKLLPEAKSL